MSKFKVVVIFLIVALFYSVKYYASKKQLYNVPQYKKNLVTEPRLNISLANKMRLEINAAEGLNDKKNITLKNVYGKLYDKDNVEILTFNSPDSIFDIKTQTLAMPGNFFIKIFQNTLLTGSNIFINEKVAQSENNISVESSQYLLQSESVMFNIADCSIKFNKPTVKIK